MKVTNKISTVIFCISLGVIINHCGSAETDVSPGTQLTGVSIEVLNEGNKVFQGEDLEVKFTNGTNITISATIHIYAPSDYENHITFQNLTSVDPKSSKQVHFSTDYWTEFGENWKVIADESTGENPEATFTFLRENIDRDEDGISNKIEVKNKDVYNPDAPDYHSWATDPDDYNLPSWAGGPNGNNDWTLALGQPTSGTLEHGYILPDGNSTSSAGENYGPIMIDGNYDGYWYYQGTDDPNKDNWGTLTLLQTVEDVGLIWEYVRQNYDPYRGIITSMDMSRQYGGEFSPHDSHQNGRDVEIRYIRSDGTSGRFKFGEHSITEYDQGATQELINIFINSNSGIEIILVHPDSQLADDITILNWDGHENHIHIRIPDPDLW